MFGLHQQLNWMKMKLSWKSSVNGKTSLISVSANRSTERKTIKIVVNISFWVSEASNTKSLTQGPWKTLSLCWYTSSWSRWRTGGGLCNNMSRTDSLKKHRQKNHRRKILERAWDSRNSKKDFWAKRILLLNFHWSFIMKFKVKMGHAQAWLQV